MNEIQGLQPITEQSTSLLAQSQSIIAVQTAEDAEIAGGLIKAWESIAKKIKDVVSPFVKNAYDNWKAAKELENQHLEYPESEPKRLRRLISIWSTQELERQRLAAAAQQAELDRQHEEQRLADAAKFEAAAEEARFLGDKATAAKMQGLANQSVEQAVSPPQIVTPTTVAPSGFVGRTDWKWEVVDKKAIPLEYMIPDEKAIGAMVRSQKSRCTIAGIRVFSVQNLVNRK